MTLEWIKLGLSVLNFVGLILGFFYVRLERKDTATTKSIDELRAYADRRFDQKCMRISKLEVEVSRIPTRDEFDRSQQRVESYIKGVYDRINEIDKVHQESAQKTNMLLGDIMGQLKAMGKNHGS